MNYTLREIADICGGEVFGDDSTQVTGFFTDSRQAEKNKMFIAIIGEKVDGHDYVPMVFEKESSALCEKTPQGTGNYVIVENPIKALQEVALRYRQKFDIPYIAVTGSVGKTTAKEIISLGLETELNVLKTLGNANSQVGLPITLTRVDESHRAAVIEMGMSIPGEMEKIAYCARPDIVVFTNVGVSHIEYHGSREKIMEQKLHITDYFNEKSVLIVNEDDDLLCNLKGSVNYKVISYGLSDNSDYKAYDIIEGEDSVEFSCETKQGKVSVLMPALGMHNVRNALALLAVADYLNLDMKKVASAVKEYTPPQMRQQILKTPLYTIIDDSYNAGPDSMRGAIEILASMSGENKIAVLGDMLELGEFSASEHEKVGAYAKSLGINTLIAFGEDAKYVKKGFGTDNSYSFTDYEEAENFLLSEANKNDVILCKGSRGIKTDRFVKALIKKSENT